MIQALEIDLGGLSQRSWDDGGVYGAVPFIGATDSETFDGEKDEEPSLASLTLEPSLDSLTLPDLVDSHGTDKNSLAAFRPTPSTCSSQAATAGEGHQALAHYGADKRRRTF